ncbi:MAG TPA: tetratricopeptide repeat protein [Thermoanaerobaculia bacterium]|nr:tetratricopeptide repeat protein [Thermoanaerobaculia bacterium]
MMMTNCPTDETVAAFVDGRLHPEARAEVMEHIANCPDCYALVSAGWDFQAAEQATEEKELAPVVKGPFGSWWKWTGAAVAASAILVFVVPPAWNSYEFRRERSALISAQNSAKKRPVEGRLTGFDYQRFEALRGSGDDASDDLSKYTVPLAAANLNARKARTARQWQAQSAAHLLVGERPEAIEAIEKAVTLSPNDPSILNDRIVAYLEQYRFETVTAPAALEAAQRAWQVAQTPEIAFNRALALEANGRRNEAIAAWQEYLKLDPNSPWAADAKQHIQTLQYLL